MLDNEERRRRIVAARTLRGVSQDDMDRLGHDEGLAKQELSRLERGEFGEKFSAVQRRTLSRVLRVPENWFTEPDADQLVGYVESDGFSALAQVERLIAGLDETARALRQAAGGPEPEAPDTGRRPPGEEAGDA